MKALSPIRRGLLTDVEWRVVETARSDGPLSLNPDGLMSRFLRFLGVRVARGLAKERLEALRRFSVRAWYWDLIRTTDMLAFLDAGYSRVHALEILSHVSMARGFTPTIQFEPGPPSSRTRSSHRQCG